MKGSYLLDNFCCAREMVPIQQKPSVLQEEWFQFTIQYTTSDLQEKWFQFTTQLLLFKSNGSYLLYNFCYSIVKTFKLAFNYFFTLGIIHRETYSQWMPSNYGKQMSDIIINPTSDVRNYYMLISLMVRYSITVSNMDISS